MSNDSGSNLPPFPSSYRASGLLLHVTSLPSPYGIGDVDQLRSRGSTNCATQDKAGGRHCPWARRVMATLLYQSLSSFAGNGLLISPDWLIEDGLLSASDCVAPSFSPSVVDYNAVIPFKYRLVEKAWTNFRQSGVRGVTSSFEQFCHEQAHWLEDYAFFGTQNPVQWHLLSRVANGVGSACAESFGPGPA